MRRPLLWSLLAVVAAVYVIIAVCGLSAGLNDLSNVLWAFVIVPSFALTGDFLMLKRPAQR